MNKAVIISGGGSGIGRETAMVMAAAGYKVILLGRNKRSLEETRALLPDSDRHETRAADIRSKKSLKQCFADSDLKLHAIIANAGIGGENHYGSEDRWDDILQTNLTGTYQFISEALRFVNHTQDEYSHIVIISSILARIGVPNYTAYCASKAGLNGLMRSLAVGLAQKRILVNSICPGWVSTQMAIDGITAFSENSDMSYEEMHASLMSDVLLKKMSKPSEIANLIHYLISDKNRSITGQVFDINNGAYLAQ